MPLLLAVEHKVRKNGSTLYMGSSSMKNQSMVAENYLHRRGLEEEQEVP
jgi:hypothetical protein